MNQPLDPQQLIITLLAVKYLKENGGQTVILSHDEMKALAQFTVRLEITDPETPATSSIKCWAISLTDAIKLMQELEQAKGRSLK